MKRINSEKQKDSIVLQEDQSDNAQEFQALLNAAQKNDKDAQYKLGLSYMGGLNTEQNIVEAHKWFNLSAMQGNKEALIERQSISSLMGPEEIAEAQKLARGFQNQAINNNKIPNNLSENDTTVPKI